MSESDSVQTPETRDRPQPRVYRIKYRGHHRPPPYMCFYCDQVMTRLEVVHHLDEDPWNNEIENLVAMHVACHNVIHHRSNIMTEESNQKRSQTLKLTFASKPPEFWEKKAEDTRNLWTGRSHRPETRKKMSEIANQIAKIKVSCVKCHRVISARARFLHLAAHERRGE